MPDRSCDHCGQGGFPNRDALWYHVRRCDKNDNPSCEKCGLKFVPARINGHRERCGSWNEKNAGASTPAPPLAPEEAEEGASLLGVPADHLTATDRLIVPLLASPGEKPAPPAPSPKRAPQGRENAEEEPEEPGAEDDEEEDETGLAGAFAKRDPPRTAVFQGFADSLKQNWVILAFIAALVVVVIVLRRASKNDAAERAAPVEAVAMPPPVQYRPPYNPELHGSIEAYRATFGHLPNPGGN